MLTALSFALLSATSSSPSAPTRLRASGSDWGGDSSEARFALDHGTRPKFSWAPTHPARDATQSAYELEVFEGLTPVWRSGKVPSTEPKASYPLAAPKLRAATTHTWSVATYDAESRNPSGIQSSASHAVARFASPCSSSLLSTVAENEA